MLISVCLPIKSSIEKRFTAAMQKTAHFAESGIFKEYNTSTDGTIISNTNRCAISKLYDDVYGDVILSEYPIESEMRGWGCHIASKYPINILDPLNVTYLLNTIPAEISPNIVITENNSWAGVHHTWTAASPQHIYDNSRNVLNAPNFFTLPGLRFWRSFIPCITETQLTYLLDNVRISYNITYNNESYTTNGPYFPYMYFIFTNRTEQFDAICNTAFWNDFLFKNGNNDRAILIYNSFTGNFPLNLNYNSIFQQKMDRIIKNMSSVIGAYWQDMRHPTNFINWSKPNMFSYPTTYYTPSPANGRTLAYPFDFRSLGILGQNTNLYSAMVQYLYLVVPSFITKLYGVQNAYCYTETDHTSNRNSPNVLASNISSRDLFEYARNPNDYAEREMNGYKCYEPYFTSNAISIYKFIIRVGWSHPNIYWDGVQDYNVGDNTYMIDNNIFDGMHINNLSGTLENNGFNYTLNDCKPYCQEYDFEDNGLRIYVDEFPQDKIDDDYILTDTYGERKEDWIRDVIESKTHLYKYTGKTIRTGMLGLTTYYLWKRSDYDISNENNPDKEFLLTTSIDYADLFMVSAECDSYNYFTDSPGIFKSFLYYDQDEEYNDTNSDILDARLVKIDKYINANTWLGDIGDSYDDAEYMWSNKYKYEYFTIVALEGGTITIHIPRPVTSYDGAGGAGTLTSMRYCINNGSWVTIALNSFNSYSYGDYAEKTINVSKNDIIRFRGSGTALAANDPNYILGLLHTYFTSTCKFNVQGNIASLLLDTSFSSSNCWSKDYTFYGLFDKNKSVNSSNTNECHLISARNLYINAYNNSSRSQQLAYMFAYEDELVAGPFKIGGTLGVGMCTRMFQNCSNLFYAPKLPATSLTTNCYSYMFYNCTSLEMAPVLPAQTLQMFCYNYMFYGCSYLNFIAIRNNNTTLSGTYSNNWVSGVTRSGTFISTNNANPSGVNGYPTSFTFKTSGFSQFIWTDL